MTAHSCPLCGAPIDGGRILVDAEGGLIAGGGHVVVLSQLEFAVFELLWSARPRVLSKERILDGLYGLLPDADEPEIKIIDIWVCKVRAKLRELLAATSIRLETVWGRGYRLVSPAEVGGAAAADAASIEVLGDAA